MSSRYSVNALLKKPVEVCTEDELMALQHGSKVEMKRRVFESLQLVAAQYVELYGGKEGIEEMCSGARTNTPAMQARLDN